jgi:prophage antirepressor-like protein
MTNTTALTDFTSIDGHALRSLDYDGAPWFVARDVCDALGLKQVSRAVRGLDEDEKGVTTVHTLGGPQELIIVNESGLYALIMRSRKPRAKDFRKWVTATVLPTLRQTGAYVVGQENVDYAGMSRSGLDAHIAGLRAKLEAAQTASWNASREEKDARRDALRLMKRCGRSYSRGTGPRALPPAAVV